MKVNFVNCHLCEARKPYSNFFRHVKQEHRAAYDNYFIRGGSQKIPTSSHKDGVVGNLKKRSSSK